MEGAIQTIVGVFIKSSKGKECLGKKEFQKLVSGQFSNILSGSDSKEAIDNMGQQLDGNQDGGVSFEEYMKLVGYLACSLSEQRSLDKEEPAKKDASGQVAQSTPNKEDGGPGANAESKENAKPKENEEPKADAVEPKVEATARAKVEAEVEVKAEAESKLEEAKEEAAATAEVTAAAGVKEVEKGEEKVEETLKVKEAAEKLPAAVEDAVEKKSEEVTS